MTSGPPRPCREVLETLSSYVDGEVGATERAAIDAHLALCEACRGFCETLRQTVAACREAPSPPVDRECLRRAAKAAREELLRRGLL